jgi:hypothetical protein
MNAYRSIIAYGEAHGQSPQEVEGNWIKWREQAANRAVMHGIRQCFSR